MTLSGSETGGDVAEPEHMLDASIGDEASIEAMHVRDALVDDAASIEAVHFASREAAYSPYVSKWPPVGPGRAERVERWGRWLLNPAIHCLVVERRDRIVGFITVRAATDGDMSPRRVAEMPTLYVHPAHWRSGLGTALCEAGVRRARTLGFVELVLWVLDINERARHFYASVGFRPDGAAKIDEGTPEAFKAERYRLALAAEET